MFPHDTKFRGFYGLVVSSPRIILMVAVFLAVVSLVYTAKEMAFLTGRDDLMPKNRAFHADYMAYRTEFGDPEEIVVVLEGPPQTVAKYGEALQKRLQGQKGIREVFFPASLDYFRKNGLLFFSTDQLRGLRQNLELLKPLMMDLAASPNVATLVSSMTAGIDRFLAGKGGGDPVAVILMLNAMGSGLEQYERGEKPSDMSSFLAGGDNKSTGAGGMQVLTVLPERKEGSFVPAEEAIRTVREIISSLGRNEELKRVTAGVTGTPVLEYEEMVTSKKDMNLALVVSLLLTIFLLMFAFRGILNAAAAMVSLLIAISISFGLATLLVGHLNILSMVFAVMLVGLGIEYGIQVVLRYQEELLQGEPHVPAIMAAVSRNAWSILMAALTTAAAFITFVFTDFKGIAELGIIAAAGVFICVLVTFTVLPALLILLSPLKVRWQRRSLSSGERSLSSCFSSISPRLRSVFFPNPRLILLIGLIFLALSAIYTYRVYFDYNLMNLQARGLESVDYAYKLMTSSKNEAYFAVAMAASSKEARQKASNFESLPSVDHVVILESLVPDGQPAKLQEVGRIRRLLADIKPVPYEGELNPLELPHLFEKFRASTERLKIKLTEMRRPEAQEVSTFLLRLDAFFARLEKNRETSARGMLEDFQGGMLAEFPEQIAFLKESLPTKPVRLEEIPEQVRTRFIGKSGKHLLQIAPKGVIFDRVPLQTFITELRRVDSHVTGEPVMVYESMTIMRDSYQWAFIYAFMAVVVILFITFKSLRYTLIGLSMLGAGVLLLTGTMGLFGITFNSANIIVMPLILGVGIDSGIYIINRYRSGCETPAEVVMSSAGTGVILNTLTILASFGALMVAHHRGVFSIGSIMSLGMVACLLVFVVLLPAVLSLWGKRGADVS